MWKIFCSISLRCMVESKDGRSRFIPYTATVVRFSVDAFMFKEMSNQVIKTHLEETFDFSTTVCMQSYHFYLLLYQLFMHCHMSVGSTMATSVAKSCNYDTNKKRSWEREMEHFTVFSQQENLTTLFVPSRWVELYGLHKVCACCESTCRSALSPSESFPQLLLIDNVHLFMI